MSYVFLLIIFIFSSCGSYIDSEYSFYTETPKQTNTEKNNEEEEPVNLTYLLEVSNMTLDNTWKKISFTHKIINPVIIVGPATMNDAIPTSIRIRNVSSTSFEARLYDQTTGNTHTEDVSWIAIKEGEHTLSDGTIIEAGKVNTNSISKGTGGIEVLLSADYTNAPIIYSTTNSFNNDIYLNTRVYNITTSSFYVANDPLEAISSDLANTETIAWLAISPNGATQNNTKSSDDNGGNQTEVVREYNFSTLTNMAIFSQIQTQNGSDPVTTRIFSNIDNKINIKLLEDTSNDSEQAHGGAEQVYVNLFEIGIVEE